MVLRPKGTSYNQQKRFEWDNSRPQICVSVCEAQIRASLTNHVLVEFNMHNFGFLFDNFVLAHMSADWVTKQTAKNIHSAGRVHFPHELNAERVHTSRKNGSCEARFIQSRVDVSACFAAWIVKMQNMSFYTETTWISGKLNDK